MDHVRLVRQAVRRVRIMQDVLHVLTESSANLARITISSIQARHVVQHVIQNVKCARVMRIIA